jgi:thiol-disulfide isomerase/thioredoxin
VRLSQLGGHRPVLVNLWASWCQPCQQEMPRIEAAARAAGNRLLVLGVDTADSPGSASSFLSAAHITYPQVLGRAGRHPSRGYGSGAA